MGRSRGNFHSDEDPTQRSRRKKNASSGENPESSSSGQGTSEGKRASYHCNYCNKDITGKIRIKCVVCPDFDLCVECYSVGAEVTPHKSNHPYRVMDNLSFPLICPDWNADDEILLLEGIEMYGLGNWAEVAEHVGTKSKEQCFDHYSTVYLNSPCFPLPDMTHVVGKNRKELLAMAKGQEDDKKGSTMPQPVKEEPPFSPSRVKTEELPKTGPSGRLPSSSNADPQTDKSSKGKRPISPLNDGTSLVEQSGYNPKRREFDTEYDNDAEQLLADMEFKDTDTEDERELKIRVLHVYLRRLDERQRRKDFILERNLLYQSPFQRSLSPEERALCKTYDVYMRFHTKEEHEELLHSVVSEYRTKKKIAELKEAQAAGCRTTAEADRYWELKRRRETEEASRRGRDSASAGTGGRGGPNVFTASESVSRDSHLARPAAGQESSSSGNEFDMTAFFNTFLLSEAEKRLCNEIRLAPPAYMKVQEVMTKEILNGNITKKSDAHPFFQLDPSKVDKIYDMLVKKGISQP